jgi:hypothetical protein
MIGRRLSPLTERLRMSAAAWCYLGQDERAPIQPLTPQARNRIGYVMASKINEIDTLIRISAEHGIQAAANAAAAMRDARGRAKAENGGREPESTAAAIKEPKK